MLIKQLKGALPLSAQLSGVAHGQFREEQNSGKETSVALHIFIQTKFFFFLSSHFFRLTVFRALSILIRTVKADPPPPCFFEVTRWARQPGATGERGTVGIEAGNDDRWCGCSDTASLHIVGTPSTCHDVKGRTGPVAFVF